MSKPEKSSEKLGLSDLVTRILRKKVRDPKTWSRGIDAVLYWLNFHLEQSERAVIIYRYNLGTKFKDSSTAGVGRKLRMAEPAVRALEAKAIKHLRETDCYGNFVKGFGSNDAIGMHIMQVSDEIDQIEFGINVDDFLSQDELVEILEAFESVLGIYKDKFTLDYLWLSPRTVRALGKCGIYSRVELCSKSEAEVKSLYHINSAVFKEIKSALKKAGHTFAENKEN